MWSIMPPCLLPINIRLNSFTVGRTDSTGSSCCEFLPWLHMWLRQKQFLSIHTALALMISTRADHNAALRARVSELHSRLLDIYCFPPWCEKRAILYIKSLLGEMWFFPQQWADGSQILCIICKLFQSVLIYSKEITGIYICIFL